MSFFDLLALLLIICLGISPLFSIGLLVLKLTNMVKVSTKDFVILFLMPFHVVAFYSLFNIFYVVLFDNPTTTAVGLPFNIAIVIFYLSLFAYFQLGKLKKKLRSTHEA